MLTPHPSRNKKKSKATLPDPLEKDLPNRVHTYERGGVNREILATRAKSVLDKIAFGWQLDVAESILCGEDVIVDVGTGNGKTLCFQLPLLLHDTDIVMRVTPLTALMIDQVSLLSDFSQP